MFHFGFTGKDVVRSVWAFVAPFVVVFAAGITGVVNDLVTSCKVHCDWSTARSASTALIIALASSILISIKNLLLADGSTAKG